MPKQKKSAYTETLTGIVTPVAWEDDRVVGVMLCANDDEDYRIENGDKFFDLVQTSIEATGTVRRDRKSFRSINIKRFNILESF